MKLGRALIFIFLSVCTIIGLGMKKFYDKYFHKNFITSLTIRFIVFLAILRVSLWLIVPLVKSILGYLNIRILPLGQLLIIGVGQHPVGTVISLCFLVAFLAFLKYLND